MSFWEWVEYFGGVAGISFLIYNHYKPKKKTLLTSENLTKWAKEGARIEDETGCVPMASRPTGKLISKEAVKTKE